MWPSRDAERQRIVNELNDAKNPLGLNGLINQAAVEALGLVEIHRELMTAAQR